MGDIYFKPVIPDGCQRNQFVAVKQNKTKQTKEKVKNMAELITGASYPAKRTAAIVVQESKGGALMAYIPFTLTGGVQFTGNHPVCLGAKDGSMQELNIQNLMDIFGWDGESLSALQSLPIPEGDTPEFVLADYHNEPWENSKGEQVDNWCFRWLNRLGSGIAPATHEQLDALQSKWGKKLSVFGGKPAEKAPAKPANTAAKVVEAEVVKKPKRGLPAKKSSAPRFKESMDVFDLLLKKHFPGREPTEDEQQKLGNDVWFPAQDELFGQNQLAETPEQLEQLAQKLGL